jgi:hypothetical protein
MSIKLEPISPNSGAYIAGMSFESEQQISGDERPVVKVGASELPTGAATEQGLDDLLTELRLKADLTETQPVGNAMLDVAFSTSTVQAVGSTNVAAYRGVAVQINTQGGSSTVTFQASNDNVNWRSVALTISDSVTTAPVVSTTTVAAYYGPLHFRYFRLNVTGITSGTTSGVISFSTIYSQANPIASTAVTLAAAATNVAKAEDSAAASTNVGIPPLVVRADSLPANAGVSTDGDYAFMFCDNTGRLYTASIVTSSVLPTGAATSAIQTDGTQKTRIVDATTGLTPSVEARKQTPTGNALNVQIGPGDVISSIPVVMDFNQHQIHEGEFWHWDVLVSNLASGSNYDIVFTVPNITIPGGVAAAALCPHFRYEANVNDLCNVFLYEGPTVTAATGTARTPINLERNGSYTVKLAILDAPTITAVGTLIDAEYFLSASTNQVSANSSGSSINEFVLKNNTKYLFRITSGANGCDIHVDFHWYEDLGV